MKKYCKDNYILDEILRNKDVVTIPINQVEWISIYQIDDKDKFTSSSNEKPKVSYLYNGYYTDESEDILDLTDIEDIEKHTDEELDVIESVIWCAREFIMESAMENKEGDADIEYESSPLKILYRLLMTKKTNMTTKINGIKSDMVAGVIPTEIKIEELDRYERELEDLTTDILLIEELLNI